MVIQVTLVSKSNKLYWSDKMLSVTKEQKEAFEKKSNELTSNKDAKFNLLVRNKQIEYKWLNKCTAKPDEINSYVDAWIDRCVHPVECKSGRCRMGVVLK